MRPKLNHSVTRLANVDGMHATKFSTYVSVNPHGLKVKVSKVNELLNFV